MTGCKSGMVLPAAVPDCRCRFLSPSFSVESLLDRHHSTVICTEHRAGICTEQVLRVHGWISGKFRREVSAVEMFLV